MRRKAEERGSSQHRPRLSVCMIVKDEEPFLATCLESAEGLADEIVVVDTGSTDRTVEIARGYGAEVVRFPWNDDFAAARNESLRHATGEWILVLDADERLDRASHDEIRTLIQCGEPVGYALRMLNYAGVEGTAAVVEHLNLRLFPNRPDLRFVGRDPHARLMPRDPGLGFRVVPCGVVVHHEGYRPQVFGGRRKAERNRLLLERAVREKPNEPFNAHNLGVAYYALGMDRDAERQLLRALVLCTVELSRGRYPPFLATTCVTLALALLRQQRFSEALVYCECALRLSPDLADAHLAQAAVHVGLGDDQAALRAYERALECDGRPAHAVTDRSAWGWKPLLGMGQIYLRRRSYAEAVSCLERAHTLHPDGAEISRTLAHAREGLSERTANGPATP